MATIISTLFRDILEVLSVNFQIEVTPRAPDGERLRSGKKREMKRLQHQEKVNHDPCSSVPLGKFSLKRKELVELRRRGDHCGGNR